MVCPQCLEANPVKILLHSMTSRSTSVTFVVSGIQISGFARVPHALQPKGGCHSFGLSQHFPGHEDSSQRLFPSHRGQVDLFPLGQVAFHPHFAHFEQGIRQVMCQINLRLVQTKQTLRATCPFSKLEFKILFKACSGTQSLLCEAVNNKNSCFTLLIKSLIE